MLTLNLHTIYTAIDTLAQNTSLDLETFSARVIEYWKKLSKQIQQNQN